MDELRNDKIGSAKTGAFLSFFGGGAWRLFSARIGFSSATAVSEDASTGHILVELTSVNEKLSLTA